MGRAKLLEVSRWAALILLIYYIWFNQKYPWYFCTSSTSYLSEFQGLIEAGFAPHTSTQPIIDHFRRATLSILPIGCSQDSRVSLQVLSCKTNHSRTLEMSQDMGTKICSRSTGLNRLRKARTEEQGKVVSRLNQKKLEDIKFRKTRLLSYRWNSKN